MPPLKPMTITFKQLDMTGCVMEGILIVGEWEDMCLGVKFLIIGEGSLVFPQSSGLLILGASRFDPSGFIVEHYVDGDLFDNTVPVNRTRVGPDNLHIWGPELPVTFMN
ncbi:hypothetical protein VCV18_003301 [Metarhizium anisopliae]